MFAMFDLHYSFTSECRLHRWIHLRCSVQIAPFTLHTYVCVMYVFLLLLLPFFFSFQNHNWVKDCSLLPWRELPCVCFRAGALFIYSLILGQLFIVHFLLASVHLYEKLRRTLAAASSICSSKYACVPIPFIISLSLSPPLSLSLSTSHTLPARKCVIFCAFSFHIYMSCIFVLLMSLSTVRHLSLCEVERQAMVMQVIWTWTWTQVCPVNADRMLLKFSWYDLWHFIMDF